jgi:hypothetical protein
VSIQNDKKRSHQVNKELATLDVNHHRRDTRLPALDRFYPTRDDAQFNPRFWNPKPRLRRDEGANGIGNMRARIVMELTSIEV